jgi:hypothetical protein
MLVFMPLERAYKSVFALKMAKIVHWDLCINHISDFLNPLMKIRMKEEEEQETIKKQFNEFKNLYNFLSQIIHYNDSDLEELYIYL